ncbi:ABC transporter permease [Bradyrhizobium sp. BRP22]|uniref:ABC transporter permease n=1 Tax=Bradyrhizobium sp. BRP22 TaxID=2793821 RepID=UPI001CD59BE6|nr:ABC transporter permease [Bradyrhizobium sp. BRP22]MCA1453658.1 ABC transporter permease [Bradyrhizobium sp. BRP22]
MLTELEGGIGNDVLMGLAQAVGAIVLCAAVVALCRWHAVRVEREAAVSMARGLVQMVLVGMVLAVLLHGSLLIGTLILLMMTIAAAFTAARRLQQMEGALLLCFWAIAAGAGTVIAAMLATRSLRADIAILVPVGSMIIANAMNACAQAAERFRAEILAHVGQIEAGLTLGAEPAATVVPYFQSAVYASLLPRLDMLKSLGLVWIPGVMAGMMVSGASPVYAAIYQFVVVAMILAASGITGLVATILIRSRVFTSAAQLAFRPNETSTSRAALRQAHPVQ